jgi:putative spermidine/putrescine transport system substrate-binding protein
MRQAVRRRDFLAGAAAVAGAGAVGLPRIGRAQAQSLVVNTYGGRYEEFMRSTIIPGFESESGAKLEVAVGLGKEWLAQLRAAGPDNPPYDVLMTNEAWASIERAEGFFEPLPLEKVPNLADLYPVARLPEDNGVIAILQPIGLAYRTDMVETPPGSWQDLWKEEYRGKLGLYTITNSAGMMFLLMMGRIYGGSQDDVDVAFEKIEQLQPFAQVDFSGTMEIQLTRGEVAIAPLDFPAVARLKEGGAPIEVAAPEEGMFMFEQVFNMLKGSQSKELGYQWIDYNLRPDVQEQWVREFYISPANTKVEVPADLAPLIPISGERTQEIVTFDWTRANEQRDAIIERWNKTIR